VGGTGWLHGMRKKFQQFSSGNYNRFQMQQDLFSKSQTSQLWVILGWLLKKPDIFIMFLILLILRTGLLQEDG
jgi:hypothetical protein